MNYKQQHIARELVRDIMGHICAGEQFHEAVNSVRDSHNMSLGYIDHEVWYEVMEVMTTPSLYCGRDDEGMAVYINVSL